MFCHMKSKSPLDTTAFNPDTEYVIGNQALNGCKTSESILVECSGTCCKCIINVMMAIKRPASPNAVTKH